MDTLWSTPATTASAIVLTLGLALRLTRLVVTDDIGLWFIRYPAMVRALAVAPDDPDAWPHRMVGGLTCPFCVGFWLCGLSIASAVVALSIGGWLATAWWVTAGWFTLSWVVGHLAVAVGDTNNDEDEG